MRERYRCRALLLALLVSSPALADRLVALRVEPQQPVRAVVLRSGDEVLSLPVTGGRIAVPASFALPWTVGLVRFEPVTYTASDLAARRPLLLRELGTIRGAFEFNAARESSMTWLLRRAGGNEAMTAITEVREDGSFAFRHPAGTWDGAVLGRRGASRIRSGIVVRPGLTTDVGTIEIGSTAALVLRVVDASTGEPVAAARAAWDPPPTGLNASVSRILFSEAWSAKADRRGVVRIPAAGPLPLAARWRVEADGFAPAATSVHLVSTGPTGDLGEVRLKREASLVVNVAIPDEAPELAGALLVLGDRDAENPRAFDEIARAPLRPGSMRFAAGREGPKRLRVETAERRVLAWRDFDQDSPTETIELRLAPLQISGTVSRGGEGVAGAFVSLSDPAEARTILGRARSGEGGRYSLRTWQRDALHLYAIPSPAPGVASAAVRRRLENVEGAEIEVDFDIEGPAVRVAVVDAVTGTPVAARISHRITMDGGSATAGASETDRAGRLRLENPVRGTAHLVVTARGYQAREIELPLEDEPRETKVPLQSAEPRTLRVADASGQPVSGAEVSGGYPSELAMRGTFLCITDSAGACEVDSPPPPGTIVYAVARGFGLGIGAFDGTADLTIVVHPPAPGTIVLRPDHALPTKLYLTTAAPSGGAMIPMVVLAELAFANGLTPYQLQGSTPDGTLILAEFLPPGSWDLYLALRGGSPYIYQKVTTLLAPIRETLVVSFPSRRGA